MNYIYIFFIVLFSLGCFYIAYSYYQSFKKSQKEVQFKENKEFLKKANEIESVFYFFHTKWCPHCKDAMSIWKEDIKDNAKFKKYKTFFTDIDCEAKENAALVEKHNIKEYPTYILVANDKTYEYDANLDIETLERFFVSAYKNI